MIIITLILLGLCFGSFVNALVWRLHKQSKARPKKSQISDLGTQYSILKGRSMCVNCGHTLQWYDLLPVISWLSLAGKCRYCKKPIHWQYPAVELLTAALFVLSYISWPSTLHTLTSIVQFGLWLAILVGLVALVVYDLRWMILPNKIIFPLYGLAALYVLLQFTMTSNLSPITSAMLGVAVGGGIFYVLFQLSDGRWIGGGDVKLGFLLGAMSGSGVQAMLLLFIASLIGCIVALPLLVSGKASRSSRIPFGPFLIISGFLVVLFSQSLTDWYINLLT